MTPAEVERHGVAKHVMSGISERPVVGRELTENLGDKLFGKAK